MSHYTYGDLLLLHGLKKGRLGLGRSSVDLVRKKQVTEYRTWLECEFSLLSIIDICPGYICWKKVRSELDSLEVTSECICKGIGHQCLCKSGKVLE